LSIKFRMILNYKIFSNDSITDCQNAETKNEN
jgi:hypothetical protein